MSLIKPASLEEFDVITGGVCDEHDRDDNFGTRKKDIIQKIAKLATKRLTERQLSIYTRFYVDGKKVAEIAEEDGIHISAVYRHLQKAEKNIFEFKEMCLIYSGQPELLERFRRVTKDLPPTLRRISNDYFLNKITVQEISDQYGVSCPAIFNRLSQVKRRLSSAGITPSDMKLIRKIMKAG